MILSSKKNLIILLCLLSFGGFFSFTLAQTKEVLEQKIQERGSEIEELNKEMNKFQQELSLIGTKAQTLSNYIQELSITIKKINTDIRVTETKINSTEERISSLSGEISETQKTAEKSKEALEKAFLTMHKEGNRTITEAFLGMESITKAWDYIDSLRKFQSGVSVEIDSLLETKEILEVDKRSEEQAKKELVSLKTKLSDQKKIAESTKKEQDNLLKQTKNQEANYQTLLKNNLALKNQFEKDLQAYEAQLKFILDPKTIPARGSRVLAWSLESVLITQMFGKTVDAVRLYASGSHSGVDFRSSIGTPVLATASGTVLGTGDTDLTCPKASFGKWILIEHTNGLSTAYGHLSLIKVSKNQQVKAGDVIGYSGNTGHTTGPHLHLTVYASKAVKIQERPSSACVGKNYVMPIAATNGYLDPLDYLPVPSKTQIK